MAQGGRVEGICLCDDGFFTAGIAVVEKGMLKIDQYTQEQFSRLLAEDSRAMFQAGVGSVLQLLGGLAVPIFAFFGGRVFTHLELSSLSDGCPDVCPDQ